MTKLSELAKIELALSRDLDLMAETEWHASKSRSDWEAIQEWICTEEGAKSYDFDIEALKKKYRLQLIEMWLR